MSEEQGTKAPPSAPETAGLALVSLTTLALQVSLTRVFSLLIWYHFAFLAVAIALLGFTAGGLITQARAGQGASPADLSRRSFYLAGSIMAGLLIACHLPLEESVLASPFQFALFVALVLVMLVPFVIAGLLVSAQLSSHGGSLGRLYVANLAGSGVGCIVSVAALDTLGGGAGGVLVSAAAAAMAGLFYAEGAGEGRKALRSQGGFVLLSALVLLGFAQRPLSEPFYIPNAKLYPRVPKAWIAERKCTSVACVDFFFNPAHFGLWGIAQGYDGPKPEQVGVVIDAWAITSVLKAEMGADGKPDMRHPVLEALPPSMVFHMLRGQGKAPGDALVIGAGGGIDVRTALHFGARHVDGVDINPTILDAVKGPLAPFAGHIYQRPDVRIVHAEGRHFARRSQRRYDVIQVSGVDTFAASQAGAFALSENYLYTVEAISELLSKVTDDGVLSFTRWLYKPPRQTLRTVIMADEALRAMGLEGARDRVAVVAAPVPEGDIDFSVILMKRTPFTAQELDALDAAAKPRGFSFVYAPQGRSPDNPFKAYFDAPDKQAFIEAYPFRVDACTDDRPFYFEHNRFSRLFSSHDAIFGAANGQVLLLVTLAIVTLSGALFLLLPRVIDRRRGEPSSMSTAHAALFVLLGAGYMGVEMTFVPRFVLYLGNPSHALSVVLFAMLVFSGLGSAFASRVARGSKTALAAVLGAAALVLLVYRFALGPIFDATLALPFFGRVAITCLLVGLPSLLMGVPFAAAIERESGRSAGPAWVARAWVVNGYASVVVSVLALVIAMAGGFSTVLLLSSGCYAVAAVCIYLHEARAAREAR